MSSTSAKTDYNGKAITLAIVSAYLYDTANNNVGRCCNSYKTIGTSPGDWYLPAVGKIVDYVSTNYTILTTTFSVLGSTLYEE